MLNLVRRALQVRRDPPFRGGLSWRQSPAGTLVFERKAAGRTIVCALNVDGEPLAIPDGELLVVSEPGLVGDLPPATAAWVEVPSVGSIPGSVPRRGTDPRATSSVLPLASPVARGTGPFGASPRD